MRRPIVRNALQLAAFASFAIAQPLFDQVGRNPTFFTMKSAGSGELVAFALIVALVPIVVLVLLEVLAYAVFRMRGMDVMHGTLVLILATLIFLPVVKRFEAPDATTVVGALLLGTVLTALVIRVPLVGRLAAIASVSTVAFVGILLLATPASGVLRADVEPIGSTLAFERAPPIVVLRTDELPLSSLVTPDGLIDSSRYPNFARFAENSTWYRNATTVNDGTRWAVPSMFTGRLAPSWSAQIPAHHPRSVFTALGGVYDFRGRTEGICPATVCGRKDAGGDERPSSGTAVKRSLADAAVLYGHLVGTDAITSSLTPAWALGVGEEFRGSKVVDGARAATPDRRWSAATTQVSGIAREQMPFFELISVWLPHLPWTLLPSGQTHSEIDHDIPGLDPRGVWTDEPQPVRSSYTAHLAQVGAVDELLGRLIDRLESQDLFDDAMIVVISDHGGSFIPGQAARLGRSSANLADVALVPFMIKYPGQREGSIDDRAVQVMDLLPTILGVVGSDPGWQFDGNDLTERGESGGRTITHFNEWRLRIPNETLGRLRRAAGRKHAFLGLASPPADPRERFFASGEYAAWVGRDIGSFQHRGQARLRFTLEDAAAYEKVDVDSSLSPAAVTAFAVDGPAAGPIAVAVNGRLAAVTDVIEWNSKRRIDALFWPGFLRDGRNEIQLFEVDGETLRPIEIEPR